MDTMIKQRDLFFKGQQADETLICFMRHHWIYILKEFIYFAIFCLTVGITLYNFDSIQEVLRGDRTMKLLFATIFLIASTFLHRFFIKLLNYFVNIGIITDLRFIDHQKSLFFIDTMDAIDIGQIQNIERLGDGVLPSLLGYGDLKVFLNASSGVKTFNCIPNVKFHFRCLSRQKEDRQHQMRTRGELTDNYYTTALPATPFVDKIAK